MGKLVFANLLSQSWAVRYAAVIQQDRVEDFRLSVKSCYQHTLIGLHPSEEEFAYLFFTRSEVHSVMVSHMPEFLSL